MTDLRAWEWSLYPVAFSNISRALSVIFSLAPRGAVLPPPSFFSTASRPSRSKSVNGALNDIAESYEPLSPKSSLLGSWGLLSELVTLSMTTDGILMGFASKFCV